MKPDTCPPPERRVFHLLSKYVQKLKLGEGEGWGWGGVYGAKNKYVKENFNLRYKLRIQLDRGWEIDRLEERVSRIPNLK